MVNSSVPDLPVATASVKYTVCDLFVLLLVCVFVSTYLSLMGIIHQHFVYLKTVL